MVFSGLRETLLILPGILMGFSFHEYAHAQVAVWLGDDTPKNQGRLSISPLVHIDPMGFLLLLIARFGWAKPVQINPRNFKNPKRDDILVSLAGPAMNILLAIFFVMIIKGVTFIPVSQANVGILSTLIEVLQYAVWINIALCVFNLLPIPPLDGSHVFFGIFNLKRKEIYYQLQSNGRIILLILIITNVIDKVIGIPSQFIYGKILSIFF